MYFLWKVKVYVMENDREFKVNQLIKTEDQNENIQTNNISDGYHTFGELYNHRIALYLALLENLDTTDFDIWWSEKHYDNTEWDGWLIVGCQNNYNGEQISYHVNADEWKVFLENSWHINHCKKSPYEFDGHSSDDVTERLKKWFLHKERTGNKTC